MIQRKQTLYIILSIILVLFSLVYIPYAISNSNLDHLVLINEPFTLIWLILFCVFSLISIFKFKNRKQQLYYVQGNLLGVVSIILIIYAYNLYYTQLTYIINWVFTVSMSIASVLLFLAQKAIKHDDDLINSINRLR